MRLERSIRSLVVLVVAATSPSQGQTFRHAGTEFEVARELVVPDEPKIQVGVVEFHHHGQLAEDGRNILVVTADRKPMPTRLLQQGPGDFCRAAFQIADGQRSYILFYGGDPPRSDDVPAWTDRSGLLLETREYRPCNLDDFKSVKAAFESSKPIGSGYVHSVQHGSNPFTLTTTPFLSHYTGTLHIDTAGEYGFLTSSEDSSFLLIDDQPVVDAPGRHPPERWAKPKNRVDIHLNQGTHKFDYYHVATGPNTMMVVAWEPSPRSERPRPVAIPPSAFRADAAGKVDVGPPVTQQEKLLPDFAFQITGSVPLPEDPQHLLGVQFENRSPPILLSKSKITWDFGDGQTSDQPNPEHVFLRPGLYPVKLSIQKGTQRLEITYTLEIDQRRDRPRDPPDVDRYLPILETYDPAKLDVDSLRQLVQTYVWKADLTISPKDEPPSEETGEGNLPDPAAELRQLLEREAAAREYLARAVDAAKVAFTDETIAAGDEPLFELAQLAAPIARNDLGDSRLAGQIWFAASQHISRADLRAQSQLAAADVALNDLLLIPEAKGMLDRASAAIGQIGAGNVQSRLHRIWGDYYAATGDGKRARKEYSEAEKSLPSQRSHVEQTAWRGAHSRSTEHFLRNSRYAAAARQLQAWQSEFPSERVGGYFSLLLAQYWTGRENCAAAIAQAERLLVVNPSSPYADQLLALAAKCEEKLGRMDRAAATLQSLLTDYPGSPLVPEIRDEVKRLESASKQ